MKVLVLYDFSAQPNTSELTIRKDEILTLLNKNVGEGWWEGMNHQGERGLFPAGYVEEIKEEEIGHHISQQRAQDIPAYSIPEPAPHQPIPVATNTISTYPIDSNRMTQAYDLNTQQQMTNTNQPHQGVGPEEPDWPDEDWEDEEDSGDNATEYGHQIGHPSSYSAGVPYYNSQPPPLPQHQVNLDISQSYGHQGHPGHNNLVTSTANLSLSEQQKLSQQQIAGGAIRPKKNINTFTNLVKSGLERYILDDNVIKVSYQNQSQIQTDPELGIVWRPSSAPYSCSIATHGKESKMKGFKTFISYDVRTPARNTEVRRRYKHFDWLMQRLGEKFIMTPLPPLPEKQIAGRFHDDFVEHRRNLLQLWVNYVTRHPILSQCDVWSHFITCPTDDMKGWKLGKRRAEKDELVGANFFFSIEVVAGTPTLDNVRVTKQLENFQRFVYKFDEAVKHMYNTTVDQSKKFSSIYSKDIKRLSEGIKELSSAFQSGTAWRNSLALNESIRQTSAAYEDISRLYEEQPKVDFEPMADLLHQYKGLLANWPEILQLHKNAINTRNEQERLKEDGKINDSVVARVNERVNVTTYNLLAEINHFHNERLTDFKTMMQSFLQQQINFYQNITLKLQNALIKVNDA